MSIDPSLQGPEAGVLTAAEALDVVGRILAAELYRIHGGQMQQLLSALDDATRFAPTPGSGYSASPWSSNSA